MVSSAHQCCTWRPSLLALRAGPWAGPLGRIPFVLVRAPKCSFQWGWQRRGVRSAGSSLPTQGAPALKGAEKPFDRAGRLVPGVQPRLRESLGCRGAPISQTHSREGAGEAIVPCWGHCPHGHHPGPRSSAGSEQVAVGAGAGRGGVLAGVGPVSQQRTAVW